MHRMQFKRAFDLCLTIPGLIIFTPVMLLLAILVRWRLGSPVIFRQERPGYQGQPFIIYKFRTMREAYDRQGRPLPDHLRISRLGRFLRSTSLDELPELLNVLKGEMSLVGPRPLLMKYLALYSAEQARRHEMPPGLTGWAQVNGRNAISWEEKFRLDIWYIDHWSPMLDCKILLLTVVKVLRREGVEAGSQATAEEFTGSQSSLER